VRRVLHGWHLLSLDAPTVATIWTALIAASAGVHLPTTALLAMFLAVWTLYAADRLLDARPLRHLHAAEQRSLGDMQLEARHWFHHHHRRHFLTALAAVTVFLGCLLPRLPIPALQLDLLLGTLLFGYFVVIHATNGVRLPKEIAVGLFFAAAVFIPTISRRPDLRLAFSPLLLLFAALCSLNCVAIYKWEHADDRALQSRPADEYQGTGTMHPHAVTQWAVSHLRPIGYALVIASTLMAAHTGPGRPGCLAVAFAAGLLLLLDAFKNFAPPVTLRALADLALVTPLAVWPALHVLLRR